MHFSLQKLAVLAAYLIDVKVNLRDGKALSIIFSYARFGASNDNKSHLPLG